MTKLTVDVEILLDTEPCHPGRNNLLIRAWANYSGCQRVVDSSQGQKQGSLTRPGGSHGPHWDNAMWDHCGENLRWQQWVFNCHPSLNKSRVCEACDVCPVCSMQPCDPVECANYYFVNRKIDCSPFLLSPSVWGQTSLNLNARWPQPPHRLDHSARVCSKCCLVMGPTYERMQWLKKYVGVLQLGFKTVWWGYNYGCLSPGLEDIGLTDDGLW